MFSFMCVPLTAVEEEGRGAHFLIPQPGPKAEVPNLLCGPVSVPYWAFPLSWEHNHALKIPVLKTVQILPLPLTSGVS